MNTLTIPPIMDFLKKNDRLISLDQLPKEIRDKIEKLALVDIYKDQAKEQIKASQINIQDYLDNFIASFKSEPTRKTYRKAIEDFMTYAESNGGLHPLMIKAELVDQYVVYMGDKFTANSIRLKVSAVSSFYEKLKRYNLISSNPFHGTRLPKKEYKKAVKLDGTKTTPVMNDADFITLKKATKGNLSRAIHFMATYGLRVGALPTIKVVDDYFIYTTKGNKGGRKELANETKKLIDTKQPLKNVSISYLKVELSRLVKKMVANGDIQHGYSCHDFRHYFAVNHYTANKDIYKLCKALDHASVGITEIYLQSIQGE